MPWLWFLLALLVAAAAGYVSYRADVKRAVPYPWLTAALRGMVVLLTVLLLIAPVFTITKHETRKPVILFVQDNSRSIKDALGRDSNSYNKQAGELVEKLAGKYNVVTWNLDGNAGMDSLFRYTGEATDLSSALTKAQEYYGTQNLGAVILATDGRYNQGVNPVYQSLSLKGPLYTVGIGDTSLQKDLRIANVYANKTVSLNNSFEIRADIVASKSKGYNNTISVTESGSTVATAVVNVSSDKYDRSVSFTLKANRAGLHHYVITAPVADGETNTANNRRDVFVEVVDEQKHILIAAAAPDPDIKAIREALAGLDNYKITVRVNNDFPSLLDDYDILILHQLPGMGYRSNPTIIRSDKPTWYILGNKTDNNALGSMKKPVVANISNVHGRNVFPSYNS
ncbi:MAG: VWA domain-containing protein, partial [Taibaiella sp.]|nr:VWA domain-containing protein [Taibaiella sp.]